MFSTLFFNGIWRKKDTKDFFPIFDWWNISRMPTFFPKTISKFQNLFDFLHNSLIAVKCGEKINQINKYYNVIILLAPNKTLWNLDPKNYFFSKNIKIIFLRFCHHFSFHWHMYLIFIICSFVCLLLNPSEHFRKHMYARIARDLDVYHPFDNKCSIQWYQMFTYAFL